MTITQVSQKYGLSQDTLRYYERIGIIPPVPRHKSRIGLIPPCPAPAAGCGTMTRRRAAGSS